jgi:anoctamin-10
VVNTFLELILPFLLRFFSDWRAGKTTIKEVVSREAETNSEQTEVDVEKRFMDKVERELALPEYSLFSALVDPNPS